MEIVRFAVAALLFLSGLFILGVATLGLYRLSYVLNRMNASAKCDTLASLLILLAIAIMLGVNGTTIKLALLLVFIWLTNPAAVFLIARSEVLTNPYLESECEVVER